MFAKVKTKQNKEKYQFRNDKESVICPSAIRIALQNNFFISERIKVVNLDVLSLIWPECFDKYKMYVNIASNRLECEEVNMKIQSIVWLSYVIGMIVVWKNFTHNNWNGQASSIIIPLCTVYDSKFA